MDFGCEIFAFWEKMGKKYSDSESSVLLIFLVYMIVKLLSIGKRKENIYRYGEFSPADVPVYRCLSFHDGCCEIQGVLVFLWGLPL